MEKTIRIFGKDKETQSGKKFVSFSYTKDGVIFYDVRFNKECDNVPKTSGYWLITVNLEDLSKKNGKKLEDGTRANPIIWVANIIKKVKDTAYEKQVEEKRKAELEDIFE